MLQKRLAALVLAFSSGSIKKATGGFKNLQSEKLNDLCMPQKIIGVKSRMCVYLKFIDILINRGYSAPIKQ